MRNQKNRIILGMNVLYAGLYSNKDASFKVVEAIKNEKIKIVLSTTLLFEYEDILKRNQEDLGLSNKEIEEILDFLCLISEHQKIYFLWRPQLPDAKDDHLLELAIASKTQTIITHNNRNFKGIDKFGIQSVSPKELMEKLK